MCCNKILDCVDYLRSAKWKVVNIGIRLNCFIVFREVQSLLLRFLIWNAWWYGHCHIKYARIGQSYVKKIRNKL